MTKQQCAESKGWPSWFVAIIFGSIGAAPFLLWTGLITTRNYDAYKAANRPAIESSSQLQAKTSCEQFVKTLSGRWKCIYYDEVLEQNFEFRDNLILTWLFRTDNGYYLTYEDIGMYVASEIRNDGFIGDEAKTWHFEK